MPTVTVVGGENFEVEKGKKLVLAFEDNGVHILHPEEGIPFVRLAE